MAAPFAAPISTVNITTGGTAHKSKAFSTDIPRCKRDLIRS